MFSTLTIILIKIGSFTPKSMVKEGSYRLFEWLYTERRTRRPANLRLLSTALSPPNQYFYRQLMATVWQLLSNCERIKWMKRCGYSLEAVFELFSAMQSLMPYGLHSSEPLYGCRTYSSIARHRDWEPNGIGFPINRELTNTAFILS